MYVVVLWWFRRCYGCEAVVLEAVCDQLFRCDDVRSVVDLVDFVNGGGSGGEFSLDLLMGCGFVVEKWCFVDGCGGEVR